MAVGVAVVGALLVVLLVPGVVDVVVGAAHQEGFVAAVVADLAVLPRLEAALERARPNHIVRFIIVRWEETAREGTHDSARSCCKRAKSRRCILSGSKSLSDETLRSVRSALCVVRVRK